MEGTKSAHLSLGDAISSTPTRDANRRFALVSLANLLSIPNDHGAAQQRIGDRRPAGTSAAPVVRPDQDAVASRAHKNAYNLHVQHASLTHPELDGTFPPTTSPPIPLLPFVDRAQFADPTLQNLMTNAEVEHLAPKIGTQVTGIQLHELTDAQKDELALLVAQRGVVFSSTNKSRSSSNWSSRATMVVVVEASVERGPAMIEKQLYDPINHWHSDVTYERQPPSYTSFKMLTSPPEGGDTLWASSYEAYERLTPPMKKFLEGLTAIHSSKIQAEDGAARGLTIRRPYAESEHSVVRTHPVTKRKALFVNQAFTTRIKQLSVYESDAILRFLLQHQAQGHEFQVRYRWKKNAVAIWDNRVTSHFGTFDYLPGNRQVVRVTPHGEVPFFDPQA